MCVLVYNARGAKKKSLKLKGTVLHFGKCTYHFVAESLMRSLIPLSYLYVKVALVSVLCWKFISSDIISKLTLASTVQQH